MNKALVIPPLSPIEKTILDCFREARDCHIITESGNELIFAARSLNMVKDGVLEGMLLNQTWELVKISEITEVKKGR